MKWSSSVCTSFKKCKSQVYISDCFWDKKYLKWSNVKICTILYYDKLRISDLVKFGRTQIVIDFYLPDSEYAKLPNRQ